MQLRCPDVEMCQIGNRHLSAFVRRLCDPVIRLDQLAFGAWQPQPRALSSVSALRLVRIFQRLSLGLPAFCQGNPMERLCRDVATYLRQPAPDMVLTEAAAWFAQQSVPAIIR
jgi:hypothetical protein